MTVPDSCLTCEAHKVVADPDPDDWSGKDEVAVVCTLCQNDTRNENSKWMADRQEFKPITVSCKPKNIEKETKIPPWCPRTK